MKLAPTNKYNFYTRYLRGEFGNRPRLWATATELIADTSYSGAVTARDMVPGGLCFYSVPSGAIRAAHRGDIPTNPLPFRPEEYRYNETMPDQYLAIQGNVFRTAHAGLVLEFSEERNIGHREAVRDPYIRTETGILALLRLQRHLTPVDLDDMRILLDEYVNPQDLSVSPVVEFSTYSIPVGVLPHRNTVIWEVRAY